MNDTCTYASEDKVRSVNYTTDYERMVKEIREALFFHCEDLERQLKKELNPVTYIELTAVLRNTQSLIETINEMSNYCRKEVE